MITYIYIINNSNLISLNNFDLNSLLNMYIFFVINSNLIFISIQIRFKI